MEEEERVYWAERRRFEEEMDDMNFYRRFPGGGSGRGGLHPPGLMTGRFGPPPPGGHMMGPGGLGGPPSLFGGPPHHHHHPYMMRRPDTLEDRHCLAKHDLIYPTEAELEAIQSIVAHSESALKKVSDHLAAQVEHLSCFLRLFLYTCGSYIQRWARVPVDLCFPACPCSSIFLSRSPVPVQHFFRVPPRSCFSFLVYVWGWGSNSTRALFVYGRIRRAGSIATALLPSPVTRARCTSILAGSQFGVKLVTCSQSPLPPLLSVHVITVSSLHRNVNLAFLFFRVTVFLYTICIPAPPRS